MRPEYLNISEDGDIPAAVYSTLPSGMETTVRLQTGPLSLTAVVFDDVDYPVDSRVHFAFSGKAILFDRENGGKNVAEGTVELV